MVVGTHDAGGLCGEYRAGMHDGGGGAGASAGEAVLGRSRRQRYIRIGGEWQIGLSAALLLCSFECRQQAFAFCCYRQGVRAVINYKWQHYTRACIFLQLLGFLVWLMSFTGFVLLMHAGSRPDPETHGWHGPKCPAIAYSLLTASTMAAVPFLGIELQSIAQ